MSYSDTKIFFNGADIGTLLEPRRNTTKHADLKIYEGTTDISNHYMDLTLVNTNWRAACAATVTTIYSGATALSGYFAGRGYVPGATTRYVPFSGAGNVSAPPVTFQPDGSTGGASYNVSKVALFVCGGGGKGANITSTSGGGGGAGATSLFAVVDWPTGVDIYYSVGGAGVASDFHYTYSSVLRYLTSNPGGSGSSTTKGSTAAITNSWGTAISTVQYITTYAGGNGGNGGGPGGSGSNGSASASGETITLVTGLTGVTVYAHSYGAGGANALGYNSSPIGGGGGGGGTVDLTNGGTGGGAGGTAGGNGGVASHGGGGGGSGSYTALGPVATTGGNGSTGVLSMYY